MLTTIFYLLIFLLPNNLGKHFIYSFSYINGLLVDYLIPTLYIQDILAIVFILIWAFKYRKAPIHNVKKIELLSNTWLSRVTLLLFIALFLSVVVSINPLASYFSIFRFILYLLLSFIFSIYFDLKDKIISVVFVLSLSLFIVEILSLTQLYLQGSVFDNYLFFGEQPYSLSTFGISRELVFGKILVPPYGLFRHPNILGGFLSIVLIWIYKYYKEFYVPVVRNFLIIVMILGVLIIVATTSITAILSLLTGFILVRVPWKYEINFVWFDRYRKKRGFSPKMFSVVLWTILSFFVFISLILPRIESIFPNEPSIYRRVDLYQVVSSNIDTYFWFGSGIGTSTELSAGTFGYLDDLKYPQPIHNIFMITLLEGGIFSLLLFLLFYSILLTPRTEEGALFSTSFAQFAILGLFDHYVLTIHQINILFWLTVSFYIAYNAYSEHIN